MFGHTRRLPVIGLCIIMAVLLSLTGCRCAQKPQAQDTNIETMETDVVVVGAGIAGLSAAISAVENGAKVILLEKMPAVGGSSILSGGGLTGAETPMQEREGIEDSVDALVEFWLGLQEYGRLDTQPNEDMIRLVAERSADNLAWLEEQGVEFGVPAPFHPDPVGRLHFPKEGGGAGVINPLEQSAKNKGVEIILETTANQLLTDNDGSVTGVEAKNKDGETVNIQAKAVILATGGYARNKEMLKEYTPVVVDRDHLTVAAVGSTGDGHRMAEEIDADLTTDNWLLGLRARVSERGGAINGTDVTWNPSLHVDSAGKRFFNENSQYAVAYLEMAHHGEEYYHIIFDANNVPEAVVEEPDPDAVFKADSLEELAQKTGIDPAGLKQTVEEYNGFAATGEDPQFVKEQEHLLPISEPPFYAVRVIPTTMGTIGGLRINDKAQVLGKAGEPIANLYAAGEIANRVFYRDVYVSGSALQSGLTMGYIAGKEAAEKK